MMVKIGQSNIRQRKSGVEEGISELQWGFLRVFFEILDKIGRLIEPQREGYFFGIGIAVQQQALGFNQQALMYYFLGRFSEY
jgi:hypothetical protein